MKLIADASPIPGLQNLYSANPVVAKFTNLGDIVSGFLNIVFYLAVFLAFYFLVWGGFAYIMAQGNKENLAKARERITWALIGLVIIFLAFFIAKFVSEILPPKGGVSF